MLAGIPRVWLTVWFIQVVNHCLIKTENVVIQQPIKHMATLLAGADQAKGPQGPQLVGHSRFPHAHRQCQVPHADFPLGQEGEDAQPIGVC
jgi:hypothetical protein